MNVPNTLTGVRLLLIPVFITVFIYNHLITASIIFLAAGATDVLDGYIARKFNLVTKWGQVMDPLADKLMQLTVLTCLTISGDLPIWLIVIYGIKELTMIFGGVFLYTKKEKMVIPANKYGKVATVLFYVAVVALVVKYQFWLYIFILAVFISVFAFVQYIFIGSRKLKRARLE